MLNPAACIVCCPVNIFNSRYAISVHFGWRSSFMTPFDTSVAFSIPYSSSRLPALAILGGSIYQPKFSLLLCFKVELSSSTFKEGIYSLVVNTI